MLPGSQVTCFASWGQPLLLCGLCLSFLKKGCNGHYMGEALESRILVLPLVLCKSPHPSSHGKMGGWECPFRMSLRAGVGWFGVGQFGSQWAQDADAAPPAKALEPKRTTEFTAPPPPRRLPRCHPQPLPPPASYRPPFSVAPPLAGLPLPALVHSQPTPKLSPHPLPEGWQQLLRPRAGPAPPRVR